MYFQAELDGKVVSFVVEDKTHTEMHGGQLERYRGVVGEGRDRGGSREGGVLQGPGTCSATSARRRNGPAIPCSTPRTSSPSSATADGRERTTSWRDFAAHVASLVDGRRQAFANWDLDRDFVQWEFMVALGEALGPSRWPARWFNLGGGAWTQYPHYEQRGSLFWRLDSWKPLRLMVDTNEVGGERALAAWDGWDRAFREAAERSGLDPAPFRRVRSRNGSAVAEGTIGAVDARGCLLREGLGRCVERGARTAPAIRRGDRPGHWVDSRAAGACSCRAA